MESKIRKAIEKALKELGLEPVDFVVEHPADISHGDYSTNVAMVAGKQSDKNPHELAQELIQELTLEQVEKIEVAGAGFINFYLSKDFFADSIANINKEGEHFGENKRLNGQKTIVEFTDPNPFKEFHIGHLMSNAIGEALSRLLAYSGATVRRVNYQGDVGMHVAKAIWGKLHPPAGGPDISWGKAYAHGASAYSEHTEEINGLNKKIYERSDEAVNKLYDEGKEVTLAEFEKMYALLGTKFDKYFFESQAADLGKELVEKYTGDIFVESDGAIVYPEEKSGLHTRVFLNSQGIPTYEAKELGLAKIKYDWWQYDRSFVITANEIDEYFKVLLSAMQHIYPELAEKTAHLSHGVLRLPSGKMSSRTGTVVTAQSLIDDIKERVLARMEGNPPAGGEHIAEQVAVGALKYAILKQAIGKDIIFDIEQSLSLEGDSGPYLQYTYVRAQSVLKKAHEAGIDSTIRTTIRTTIWDTIWLPTRLLYRFPEIVDTAAREYTPHTVVHFLTEVASSFNSFYAKEKIVDRDDKEAPAKVALTQAVATVLKNGLSVLGIPTPERM